MSEQIHDVEFDTSESTVRALLVEQCPQWADRELTYLSSSGTTNVLWKAGDVVIRMPRTPGASDSIEMECGLLPALAKVWPRADIAIPRLVHRGEPTAEFDRSWAVFNWIEGTDAWSARDGLADNEDQLALDLASIVLDIRSLEDLPVPKRGKGDRGGPFRALLASLDEWLDDPTWAAGDHVDVKAIRRLAGQAAEIVDEPFENGTVHGDLIAGNLLTTSDKLSACRLSAVIDWGGVGVGDLAQDVTAAWAMFDEPARSIFRNELEVDEATWIRARITELEHTVGGIVYYRPRGNVLADVMTRTLDRLLAD